MVSTYLLYLELGWIQLYLTVSEALVTVSTIRIIFEHGLWEHDLQRGSVQQIFADPRVVGSKPVCHRIFPVNPINPSLAHRLSHRLVHS